MRSRIRTATLPLACAAWLAAAAPAWANAVDPELYPEAAAEYERMMTTVFGLLFGCFALGVILFVALVAGLIIWLVRRDKRKQAEAESLATAATAEQVASSAAAPVAPVDAPPAAPVDAPPADEAPPPDTP